MRALTAAETELFSAVGGRSTFLRVDVKDTGGTWRDLTTYPGVNLVESAEWSEGVDTQGMSGTVICKREVGNISLSPLSTTSPLNTGFNPATAPVALLSLNNEIKVFTAVIPDGGTPAAGDWRLSFHGRIDSIDWGGNSEQVELKVSDLQGALRDRYIERERVYAHADPADGDSTKGLYVWEENRSWLLADLVFPTQANRNAHFYKCTTAGLGAALGEPAWAVAITGEACSYVSGANPNKLYRVTDATRRVWDAVFTVTVLDGATAVDPTLYTFNYLTGEIQFAGWTQVGAITVTGYYLPATVTDGAAVWTQVGSTTTTTGTALETVLQQILNDNGQSAVTLNTPVSPGWAVKWFSQERCNLWDGLRNLVDQLGWDLRFKWDSGSSTFKLTLSGPDRAKVAIDRSFALSDVFEIQKLSVDLANIRNYVRVNYSDSTALDAAGHPVRRYVERGDVGSAAIYGRRYMELTESSSSNIDSSTEATTMADAAVGDLSTPSAENAVDMPFFPFVELGDLYRFNGDGLDFDRRNPYHSSNLDLAVVQYSHRIDAMGSSTTIQCRGKPSGGIDRWLSRDGQINLLDVHANALNDSAGVNLSIKDVIGGTQIAAAPNSYQKKGLGDGFEFHVSASAGFTPDPTTKITTGDSTTAVSSTLIPGKTYYAKVIPHGRNDGKIVRGQPSVEQSFVAGRASSGHINSGIALGDYPLNGGFETRLDTGSLPDHWSMYAGTYGTDVTVKEDANGFSGNRYVRLENTTGGIRSALIPILNEAMEGSKLGALYRLSWWRKAGASNSAGATYDILVRLLDASGSEVDILTVFGSQPADNKKGHWTHEEGTVELRAGDSTARSAQLEIKGSAGATFVLDLDEYRLQYLGSPWYDVGDTSNFTDNYESIPGFSNSWVNYDTANYTRAQFRRDQFGRIHVRGVVKDGTATPGTTMFTLPVGFRPPKAMRWVVHTSAASGVGVVSIDPGGVVAIQSGANGYLFMDPISFERSE